MVNPSHTTPVNIAADIQAISEISIVPTILDVICKTTGMGFACIARVTDEKWVVCAVQDEISFGLKPGGELVVDTTICHEIRQSHQAVVIDHVAEDSDFCDHLTPKMYGFQSYISFPIFLKNGYFFGTLCAIDPKPTKLKNNKIVGLFKSFTELIALHLDTIHRSGLIEASLEEERKIAVLREQFIAILGHDLRNPVHAISMGAECLLALPLDQQAKDIVKVINKSTVRIKKMIGNILDFARGRMGEGIILNRKDNEPIESMLIDAMNEITIAHPDRVIESHFEILEPVNCDGVYITQLFSNLLGNAIKHGDRNSPVMVSAFSNKSEFSLSVSNSGKPIPSTTLVYLFQPFFRGNNNPGQQGLGLGLYIAREIAKAHGGDLSVLSDEEKTRFTLTIPNK